MENSKKWPLIGLGGLVIALLGFAYFTQECITCQQASETNVAVNVYSAPAKSSKQSLRVSENAKVSGIANDKPKENVTKKHYDDDWCIAKVELSENDYHYAQVQIEDWHKLQGKARAKSPNSSHADELQYPNNSFISSYEELPIEQLKSLAFEGNKWAMVAFVQNESFSYRGLRAEIAKKLLVEGASYYALEELVMKSLVAAKPSYRLSGSTEKGKKYVIDALAYAYWGLENYSDGGFRTFNALISHEPFKTNLDLNELLIKSGQAIKDRFKSLARWVQKERDKLGIEVPEAPKAAQRDFAKNIALIRRIHKKQVGLLSDFRVTNSNPIKDIPCVDEYSAYLY